MCDIITHINAMMILRNNDSFFQRSVGRCEAENGVASVSYRSRNSENNSKSSRVIPLQIERLIERHERHSHRKMRVQYGWYRG